MAVLGSQGVLCPFCQVENSAFNPLCKRCGKDLPLVSWPNPAVEPGKGTGVEVRQVANRPRLPPTLGRYTLQRCLHEGPLSQVYAAEDRVMRRKVAIKAHVLDQASAVWQSQFLKEARALAALNHAAVVQVYDCLQLASFSCLVMEWVSGEPLAKQHLRTREDFTLLIDQVFAGLAAASRCGLVHRDLKPEHLLVTAQRQLKIIDFGLVKRLGSAKDSLPSTPGDAFWRGTPMYMSPEQIAGDRLDWRSDMFSLAVTLATCLFGRHPFADRHAALMLHKISRAEPLLAGKPPQWVNQHIIAGLRQALAKDPAQRWPSWGAFHTALLQGLAA